MIPQLLALLVVSGVASTAHAQPTCVACHTTRAEERLRRPATDAPHDVHGSAGIACIDCHGGDPERADARAHDPGHGFRGVPDETGVSILCGTCHDGSREGAADVLDAYREGAHSRATAAGREHAASCTSCHGAHGITAPDAADARTAPGHVVELCTGCHADVQTMADSGLPTDQLAQWEQSIHGLAVLAGSEEAPRCASCHDPHRTGSGLTATAACGQCHEAIRAAFDRGPHHEAFGDLGFVDCAECHGSHEVRVADARLMTGLGAACGRCHGEGQAVYERVVRVASHAAELDAARAALPRDDARRVALLEAIHALDADALEAALAALPELPPVAPTAPESSAHAPSARPLALPIGIAIGTTIVALLVFVWLRRRR